MTTPPPPSGVTSAAAIAEQLERTDDTALIERLEPVAAAVNALVPRMATTPPDAQALGAKMLGARLYRRRNTPEGVATFASEGAVYVSRNDPDVALLLGLGAYAPPVVG
jgi:hypothetical protein